MKKSLFALCAFWDLQTLSFKELIKHALTLPKTHKMRPIPDFPPK